MRLSDVAANAAADAYDALVNTGAGTAVLQLRSGPPPASIADGAEGTLLASFNLPNPAFGAASGGVITAAGLPLSTVGLAAGDVGHYRVVNRNGDAVWDSESVTTVVNDEVQFLNGGVSLGGGDFTLTLDGETTATITAGAATELGWATLADDMEDALEALSNVGVGNVTVEYQASSTADFVVTFGGALVGINLPDLIFNDLGVSDAIGVSTMQDGGPAGELLLSTLTIAVDDDVDITAWTVTQPQE